MSRDLLWKRDASGVEHPAQELLLAFIRQQCTEDEQRRVDQHLRVGCTSCHLLYTDLNQSNYTLSCLKPMSRYLYYSELQTSQVLRHMQWGKPLTSALTGKRKRKYQVRGQVTGSQQTPGTSLGVFRLSVPVAFGLLLIFATVAIVLAYTIAGFASLPSPFQGQSGSTIHNTKQIPPFITGHQTPTATLAPTMMPTASVTLTPTVTVVKGPQISICRKNLYWGAYLVICGHGFKAGDKVSLLLKYSWSNAPLVYGLYKVNKKGEFTGYLYFYQCSDIPEGITARDNTLRPAVMSNTLTNMPVVGCHGPKPTLTQNGGW